MKKNMIGGRLCEFNSVDNDIYTKGRNFMNFSHLWLDENNENIIIKSTGSTIECENTRKLSEKFDFVPRYYGCYTCNSVKKRPRYGKPGEFDEIPVKNVYLVMERLNGKSIDDSSRTFEEKLELLNNNIDEIYQKYEILCDKGVNLTDLYCRNVVIGDDGKIYFIDFDDLTTVPEEDGVPIRKKSKDEFLRYMLEDLYDTNRRTFNNNSIGGKYKKNKSRKMKRRGRGRRRTLVSLKKSKKRAPLKKYFI